MMGGRGLGGASGHIKAFRVQSPIKEKSVTESLQGLGLVYKYTCIASQRLLRHTTMQKASKKKKKSYLIHVTYCFESQMMFALHVTLLLVFQT